EQGEEVAEGLTNSVNLGAGQFCTNPGLVAYEQSASDIFQQTLVEQFNKASPTTMLTSGIHSAYRQGIDRLLQQDGVQLLVEGQEKESPNAGIPHLLQVSCNDFLSNKVLEEEVFGPSTLTITADNKQDLTKVAESLQGHLTATLYG